MARLRVSFFSGLIISAIVATLLNAQTSEEKTYPKARAVESPSPEKSPTPKKTPAKKKKSSPTPTAKPKRSKSSAASEDETPRPKKKSSSSSKAKSSESKAKKKKEDEEAKPAKTPPPKSGASKKKTTGNKKTTSSSKKSKTRKKATPADDETPRTTKRHSSKKPPETPAPPKAEAVSPRAVAAPGPNAPPPPRSSTTTNLSSQAEEPEQLTIEKYGYEKPRNFWSRLFGSGGSQTSSSGAGYRYLTRSVRAEIDRAGADRRNPRWQMIVVHNSGTRQGNARVFDYYHRHVRHMKNGLAYHFVIGNGTSTGNGQIEVGDRWRRQINGGHVHSDYLNNISLGICLVGDFNRDQPTRAQLDCCEELIRYLRQRCGKIGNRYPIVKPHRDANPPRWGTDCPGDAFPYSWFRRFRE